MKVVFEFDDFHWRSPENCLDELQELCAQCPQLKVSLFTVPNLEYLAITENRDWCRAVRRLIDTGRIRLAVHGYAHSFLEFKELSYAEAAAKIVAAERLLETASLPYAKVFKGPHWGINGNVYAALIDQGYMIVYSHPDYVNIAKEYQKYIRTVFYTWNLKDPLPCAADNPIIAHGHTHAVCGNGISEVKARVIRFIGEGDVECLFVDEV